MRFCCAAILFSMSLLWSCVVGLAAEPALNDVVQALERPFRADAPSSEAIADFQAEFVQQSRLVSLDREQSGGGEVAVRFARNGEGAVPSAQFRWQYQAPAEQLIVSDGKVVWVYLPENRQVIRSDIEATLEGQGENPMAFLTGLGNLTRDFRISWSDPARDEQGDFLLQLEPRKPSAMLRELRLAVSPQILATKHGQNGKGPVFPILWTEVTDPNGNTTRIEFKRVRTNSGLSAKQFRFEPPPGVEVVQPTGQSLGF